jgi:uridine monophosphate synthetase
MISPRKETKSYGMGVEIDGDYHAGQTALLIDDLVSQADSKVEALAKLKAAGLHVTDLMMLIDRQQGGKALLESQGYRVHTAVTIQDLLTRYHQTGSIDEAQLEKTKQYLGL